MSARFTHQRFQRYIQASLLPGAPGMARWDWLERRVDAHDVQGTVVAVHGALESAAPAVVDDDADALVGLYGPIVVAREKRMGQKPDGHHDERRNNQHVLLNHLYLLKSAPFAAPPSSPRGETGAIQSRPRSSARRAAAGACPRRHPGRDPRGGRRSRTGDRDERQ